MMAMMTKIIMWGTYVTYNHGGNDCDEDSLKKRIKCVQQDADTIELKEN